MAAPVERMKSRRVGRCPVSRTIRTGGERLCFGDLMDVAYFSRTIESGPRGVAPFSSHRSDSEGEVRMHRARPPVVIFIIRDMS